MPFKKKKKKIPPNKNPSCYVNHHFDPPFFSCSSSSVFLIYSLHTENTHTQDNIKMRKTHTMCFKSQIGTTNPQLNPQNHLWHPNPHSISPQIPQFLKRTNR
ncbi:hypothetical protein Hanom_Chr17g01572401 [Helianthus anomalus]